MQLNLWETTTAFLHGRLKVIHLKRPGFHKSYAALVFPIGGLHRSYFADKVHHFPAGTAHFLEHKCFEKEGLEMTDVFAQQGASVNAFTSYQNTAYVFETIERLEDNLKTLCDMCFYPQFTEAGIAKEKGIITQEWAMYQDNPFYRQYQRMQEALYPDHPYQKDILGDQKSIESIDRATLMAVHEAYYQPELATLILAGDSDLSALIKRLEKRITLPERSAKTPLPVTGKTTAADADIIIEDDVQDAYVVLGFKLPIITDVPAKYRHYLALDMAIDSVFGSSSDFYDQALEQGLISDNFITEVSLYDNVYDVSMATQTHDPQRFIETIKAVCQQPAKAVLSETLFDRLKKANIGASIFAAETLEGMVRSYTRFLADGITEEDLLNVQESLRFEEMVEAYQMFQSPVATVSVTLKPQK